MLRKSALSVGALLLVYELCAVAAAAQEQAGNPLQVLLQANDRFGMRLLAQAHSEAPDNNLVLAPLPLTILFGAIHTSSRRQEAVHEFDQVFGWGEFPDIRIPTRMILAVMDKPRPTRRTDFVEPGTLWMENRLLYRSPKNSPPLLDEGFVEGVAGDFGLKLVNTGDKNPNASDLRKSRGQLGALPQISPLAQVWLSSGLHMRQTWEALFMQSQPSPGQFRLESGEMRTVLKLESELKGLPHLKTEQLEAVELPCGRVAMIVVLPAPGLKIKDLEEYLIAHPDALAGLSSSRFGSVTFPQFEIKTVAHLESSLKGMGITDIFQHLEGVTRTEHYRNPRDPYDGMIPAAESRVTDLAQTIVFGADKHGIHADAETLIGAIPMGIMMAPDPFHVTLDRPFLFFVRETTTNALLFAGALMDPGNASR